MKKKIIATTETCYGCDHYGCGKIFGTDAFESKCIKVNKYIQTPEKIPDWCPLEDYPSTNTER